MSVVGIEILDQLMYYGKRALLKFIVDISVNSTVSHFNSII